MDWLTFGQHRRGAVEPAEEVGNPEPAYKSAEVPVTLVMIEKLLVEVPERPNLSYAVVIACELV